MQYGNFTQVRVDTMRSSVTAPEILQVPMVGNVYHSDFDETEPIGGRLERPSKLHGRAWYEKQEPFNNVGKLNGGVIGYKGNDITTPLCMFWSGTAKNNMIPHGLMDNGAVDRLADASEMMEAAGVAGERFVGFYKLVELPDPFKPDELITMGKYGKKVIKAYRDDPEITDIEIEKVTSVDFDALGVYVRKVQTPFRMADFIYLNPKDSAIALEAIFNTYNNTGIAAQANDLPERLDPNKPSDRTKYFTEVLPKLIGANTARLHDVGAWHKYLYPGNFDALGGVVDLDSVRSRALGLGEGPLHTSQRYRDLAFGATGHEDFRPKTIGETIVEVFRALIKNEILPQNEGNSEILNGMGPLIYTNSFQDARTAGYFDNARLIDPLLVVRTYVDADSKSFKPDRLLDAASKLTGTELRIVTDNENLRFVDAEGIDIYPAVDKNWISAGPNPSDVREGFENPKRYDEVVSNVADPRTKVLLPYILDELYFHAIDKFANK